MFTVHFGPKKVVVLAGYKTVKQALINHAEEFGDRGLNQITKDINKGHGKAIYLLYTFSFLNLTITKSSS